MRELRNTKIIAVDHGYGNMKTANTVTPTGIKAMKLNQSSPEYSGIQRHLLPDRRRTQRIYPG